MADNMNLRPISGNFGTIWWDGEAIAEVISFEANVKIDREDVPTMNSNWVDSKIKSLKGEGKFKVKKVFSTGITKLGDAIKQGRDPRSQLIGKIADPDSYGTERVVINNVWFNALPLMSFEAGKHCETEFNFGFTDYEFPDLIKRV